MLKLLGVYMPAKKKTTKKTATISKKDIEEGKVMAVLAYTMIAAPMILWVEKKNKFARFHAMQGLAALIIYLVLIAITGGILWFLPLLFGLNLLINLLAALVLIYAAVMAAKGEQEKIPVISHVADFLENGLK
jgi:uncharacterized membrane protein